MKISLLLLLLLLSASVLSQGYPSRSDIDYEQYRSQALRQNDINRTNPALNRQHNTAKEIQRQLNREMEYQDQRQMYNLMNGKRFND